MSEPTTEDRLSALEEAVALLATKSGMPIDIDDLLERVIEDRLWAGRRDCSGGHNTETCPICRLPT